MEPRTSSGAGGHDVPPTHLWHEDLLWGGLPVRVYIPHPASIGYIFIQSLFKLGQRYGWGVGGRFSLQRQAASADPSPESLTTRMRCELGAATSETRALVDMQALHTQALRAQVPPRSQAPSPTAPYGETAGPAYGWAPASAASRSSVADREGEPWTGPYRYSGYGTYPPSSHHYRGY